MFFVFSAETLITFTQRYCFKSLFIELLISSFCSVSRRSHLLSINNGVTKFSIELFSILLSSNDNPISESTTIKAISAFSRDFIEISEEYLSIWSFCFFRGIPAVSVIKYFRLLASKLSTTLSLVVPGIFDTVDLSLFSKALNRVDLPAFGLPIIVKEVARLLLLLDFLCMTLYLR